MSRRLGAIFGSPISLGPDALRPETTRSILARVLLNLRRSWERRDLWEQALEALDFAEALDPENGAYRRERGLLLLKTGRTEEALEILESYAESAGGEEAEPVLRLIRIVRGQGEAERVDLPGQPRKIFTLEQARALLPRVRDLTSEAVSRYGQLSRNSDDERESVVREWMRELHSLGLEIKGLWLVDFDSGAGYYCWKYPEPALDHFHGYEEGFAGRLSLQ